MYNSVICSFVVFLLLVAFAASDMYMQNPRGSNDRLNEANTNRNNGNRLFDSQNNAKGGYCVGPQMTYYAGSQLSIEWTNQHGCGDNPKLVCNMVVQYMCGTTADAPLSRIRDGTSTDTIPNNAAGAVTMDNTVNPPALKYGMHESYASYQACTTRQRNMGLYTADRDTQGGLTAARASSIYTRQNNNGAQNGFECPEERDYYPYWAPSQWKDIAVLTTDTGLCDYYKSNSQNVKSKGYCQDPANPGAPQKPNNPTDCMNSNLQWLQQPAFGLSAPDCLVVPWSRENHLGNGATGFANSYNTSIPTTEACMDTNNCVCVLRTRYNISSIEDGFPGMSNPETGFIDWTQNDKNSPILQDPVVYMSNGSGNSSIDMKLAVDTTQFGRTFQDRSHTFIIASRPSGVSSTARIYNLNVRGKRGNIVQTYPATEYDFVPQYLYTRVGDFVHFQWTGCDQNPAGNAGEGTAGTDRSNAVQMVNPDATTPASDAWIAANPGKVLFESASLRFRMAWIDQNVSACVNQSTLIKQDGNAGNADADVRNCGKLNQLSAVYFNGGLVKMNKTGTFNYMSTRNHSFSNRDQKGIIYVVPLLPKWAVGLLIAGGVLFVIASVVAGMMFYAKSHPHSSIATLFSKM